MHAPSLMKLPFIIDKSSEHITSLDMLFENCSIHCLTYEISQLKFMLRLKQRPLGHNFR